MPPSNAMFVRFLLLFLGVYACSTSAIFIRMSHSDPFVLTALRLLIAFVLLLPVFLVQLKRNPGSFTRSHLHRTHAPAGVLALHLISWTLGARMTVVAQATLIVNLVPIALPFFLLWLAKEKVNRTEVAGTALAVIGLITLSAKDAVAGGGSLPGDFVCLFSMAMFALYLALGRRNRDFPSIWLYVIPVYGQAALICFLVAIPRLGTFEASSVREWSIMLALGAIPTVCGHSLLNAAMRRIRGQIVSLCNVSQVVFASVMGYFLFGEVPRTLFYISSAIVVSGVVMVVLAAPPEPDVAA
ncbi:MAG TPA: DMT family transporter [Opitutaceae bacterium]|jgi:drug/metabolite transporter (DMT)-like permease|nr:DMT family transporter [Opitutaceae bacterium]